MKFITTRKLNSAMFVFLALPVSAAWGCSSDEEPEEPSVAVSEENLCDEVAEVLCYNIFQCCTGQQIEDDFGLEITTTEKDCRRDVALTCEEGNAELLYSIASGTVALEREKADACLESVIMKDQCFVVSREPIDMTACSEMFRGLQPQDAACTFGFECAEDLYCASDSKCHRLPGRGDPCPFYTCSKGLYCGYDMESSENICQTLRTQGQNCTFDQMCAEGLFCEFDGENHDEGTCRARKNAGMSCENDSQCKSGECLPGLCENGSECFTDGDCQGRCMLSGTSCSSNYDCPGHCDLTGEICTSDYDCDYLNNEPCVQEPCNPGTCDGNPVCAESHYVIDYCELNPMGATTAVPEDWD